MQAIFMQDGERAIPRGVEAVGPERILDVFEPHLFRPMIRGEGLSNF